MPFQGDNPLGTAGGLDIFGLPQVPETFVVADGPMYILIMRTNGTLTERNRENVEDVIRVIGLRGESLAGFITRHTGGVVDANTTDIDFDQGFSVGAIAPGVVVINIGAKAITTAMIADAAIGALQILDGSVGLAELAANSVNASKIVDGSVGLAELAANSVDASKIVDGSVGLAELAANSVDASKIVDGSVGLAELATAARPETVLLSENTFAGVASYSSPAVFSATYDDYLIELSGVDLTAVSNLHLKLRAGGSDISTTVYYNQVLFAGSSVALSQYNTNSGGPQFQTIYGSGVTMLDISGFIRITRPAIADVTMMSGLLSSRFATGGGLHLSGGGFLNATVADAISLIPGAGTISGTVRISGIRNTP